MVRIPNAVYFCKLAMKKIYRIPILEKFGKIKKDYLLSILLKLRFLQFYLFFLNRQGYNFKVVFILSFKYCFI